MPFLYKKEQCEATKSIWQTKQLTREIYVLVVMQWKNGNKKLRPTLLYAEHTAKKINLID